MKERYLHSVRLLLDCSPEERERLLSRLNCAISSYLEDVSDATEIDLVTNFGTPEDCAARLLEECTPTSLVAVRQKKNCHRRIIMTVLTILLTIAIGVAVFLWAHGGLMIIQTGKVQINSGASILSPGQITYHYVG